MGWDGMGRVGMGLLDWAGREGKALGGMDAWMDMGSSQWVRQGRLLGTSERQVDTLAWDVYPS